MFHLISQKCGEKFLKKSKWIFFEFDYYFKHSFIVDFGADYGRLWTKTMIAARKMDMEMPPTKSIRCRPHAMTLAMNGNLMQHFENWIKAFVLEIMHFLFHKIISCLVFSWLGTHCKITFKWWEKVTRPPNLNLWWTLKSKNF